MDAVRIVLALAATAPPDLLAVGVVARRPEASVAILRAGGRSRGGRGDSADWRPRGRSHTGVVLDFEGTRATLRLATAPRILRPRFPCRPSPPPIWARSPWTAAT
jgi:hypothetical protein